MTNPCWCMGHGVNNAIMYAVTCELAVPKNANVILVIQLLQRHMFICLQGNKGQAE